MSRGKRCEAHAHDYLVPEEWHHVRPQSRGGQSVAANMTWLCANAHSDVHYFLDLIEHYRGPAGIPHDVRISYGPKVRAVALRGWAQYADEFLHGAWDRQAAIWSTSGRPWDDHAVIPQHVPDFATAVARGEAGQWLAMAGIGTALRAHMETKRQAGEL